MRKTILLTAIVATCMMMNTSCKKTETNNNTDSTAVAANKVEEIAEEPKCEFESLDLQTFNLHGKVKRVETYWGDNDKTDDVLEFDEHGRLYIMTAQSFEGPVEETFNYSTATGFEGEFNELEGGYASMNMQRDEQHRLTHTCCQTFMYDDEGRLKSYETTGWEASTEYTDFTFDDKGNILTATYNGDGEGMEWQGNTTYKYTAFDEHGNWTSCEITEVGSYQNFDEEPGSAETTESSKRRVITYYK